MTTHIDDREIRPGDRYDDAVTAKFRGDGYWRDESLAQWVDHWASVQPDVEVFSDGDVAFTWSELRNKGYRLAAALRERGIKPGDRIQVQLPNWSEFAVIYVALARIGAVLVPTMPIYRHDEVAYVINNSGARMSFVGHTFKGFDYAAMLEEIRPQCAGLEEVVVLRAEAGLVATLFEDLVGEGDTPSDEELGAIPSGDDTHAIIYTSGTESRPKGCQHTFNTMTYSLYNLCRDILHFGPGEVMFQPSPVTHATGLMTGITGPIVLGASAHIMPAWEPVEGMRRIEKYGCTASTTATPFVRMALDALAANEFDVSSLKVWVCAGAPIPEVLMREWQAKMPTAALLPLYGCSEGFIVTACTPDGDPAKAVTSDGRAPEGVSLEIRDDDGVALPQGQEGEIWHGGPGLMLSYWRAPERTAQDIDSRGFKRSGDLGRMDADGYVRVTGRIKDVIIRGGTNISAREIEEHLLTYPGIVGAAVVGYPDDRLGERACAFVVPAEGASPTLEAVADYLRNERKIAVQKLPERLEVVDSLPTTATGKVQKFVLREEIAPAG